MMHECDNNCIEHTISEVMFIIGQKVEILICEMKLLTLFSTHSMITLGYFLLNQRKNAGTPMFNGQFDVSHTI